MFAMCQRDSSWWDSARYGKIEEMIKKKEKFEAQQDFRSTRVEKEIFGGWTALHYACYKGHIDVVKLLFNVEIGICTGQDVKVPAPGISPTAKYILACGSTPLSIALIGKQKEVVTWLLQELQDNPKYENEMIGRQDANLLCTYEIASIVGGEIAELILRNENFIEFECLTVEKGDVTVPMNCAFFGRKNVALIFDEICENEKFQEDCYKMILEKDTSGLTCVELALEPIDYDKMGTSAAEKKEVAIILRKIVDRALDYGEQKGGKFKELIAEFNENPVKTVEEIQALDELANEFEESDEEASAQSKDEASDLAEEKEEEEETQE